MRNIYRGELYYAKLFGAIGSEQRGIRPVVIVQNNIGNIYSPTVIVVPLTKKIDIIHSQTTHISVKNVGKLKYESTLLAEQVRTIDKKRLCRKIGRLPYKTMQELNRAMKVAQNIV